MNLRIQKIWRDGVHLRYFQRRGLHPLEIMEHFNNVMFQTIRAGLENKFPQASLPEFQEKMKELAENNRKIKNMRSRSTYGRATS